MFAKIVAKPSAGVENHRYVMVLPAPAPGPPRPEAKPDERERKSPKDRTQRGRR